MEEQKEPLNERIQKEYQRRKKDDSGSGKKSRLIRYSDEDFLLGSQTGKHILDEAAELMKYSKLKALSNILFEYVFFSLSLTLVQLSNFLLGQILNLRRMKEKDSTYRMEMLHRHEMTRDYFIRYFSFLYFRKQ